MARLVLLAFLVVAWASAPGVSVAEAVEPAAPLWAAVGLVGLRELLHRAGWSVGGKAT